MSKVKPNENGGTDRFKARLVEKGFSQRKDVDYSETYAPVVRYDSVRAILAIATSNNFKLVQLDVKSAYLNGDLQKEIYRP